MTRTVLSGGQVFDGTGSQLAAADVVISEGKILDVGIGLDGDEQVRRLQRPFSYQFFEAARNLGG